MAGLGGKVAAVTGGGSGIAEATCVRLAGDGAGGILAFTRTVAKELIQQGIRVNAIAPGFVDTELVSSSLTEALIGAVRMGTPQGRLGRPEEIAATIAFLCSDDASFFVGETVSPNGGFVTV
jgi:3-oxoacyl-[acyl-carrier protein] reductase